MFGLGGCTRSRHPTPTGALSGGSDHLSGHLLRAPIAIDAKVETRRIRTAILGTGIAGLSAAWKLRREGWLDAELFELEGQPGGNSRSAEYQASKAPWAAHYLPVPNQESRAVRELLQEMGMMSLNSQGEEKYNERHLCHPLRERLWYRGGWHEGFLPTNELSPRELAQLLDFQEELRYWQGYRDSGGRKAFALPLALSSQDPKILQLDKLSFGEYAKSKGWTSPFLQWLLEYATRDDYGAGLSQVSAWAGLHYFCSRDGGGFRDEDAIFVWPEGNYRIVEHLLTKLENPINTRHLVTKVKPGSPVTIELLDLERKVPLKIEADNCIYCLPSFQRKIHFAESIAEKHHYAPWVTANLVLERAPKEKSMYSEPAWDNVVYDSPSLGYVVANHQTKARTNAGSNVWTWYRSFPNEEFKTVRKRLLESRWEDWRDEILDDLKIVHPDIERVTVKIDVALFGHGMIVPSVGFIWGKDCKAAQKPLENVWFAHSDLSGISVFEEAQYRGVLAAEHLMSARGHRFVSWTSPLREPGA